MKSKDGLRGLFLFAKPLCARHFRGHVQPPTAELLANPDRLAGTMMKRAQAISLALTLTASLSAVAANLDECAALIRTSAEVTWQDFHLKLPQQFTPPSKDPFETSQQHRERVAKARSEHAAAALQRVGEKPLFLRLSSSALGARYSYDADRGAFSVLFPTSTPTSKAFKEQVSLPVITKPDGRKESTESMGLGARKVIRGYVGLAFKTKLKSKELRGTFEKTQVKVSPQRAKDLAPHLGFAFVGQVVEPWVATSYTTSLESDAVTANAMHTTYAVVDLVCAAAVDLRTYEIVQLYR